MTSPYLTQPLRSETDVAYERVATDAQLSLDLEAWKTRACASVATGGGVNLERRLRQELREADSATHVILLVKLDIVRGYMDKAFCERGSL